MFKHVKMRPTWVLQFFFSRTRLSNSVALNIAKVFCRRRQGLLLTFALSLSLGQVLRTNKPRMPYHKMVPYLRLNNGTSTSKCEVLSSTVPEKPKSWTELARRGTSIPLENIEEMKGRSFEDIKNCWKRSLTMPKKTKRRDPSVSPGIVCYAEKRNHFYSWVPWAKCSNLPPPPKKKNS